MNGTAVVLLSLLMIHGAGLVMKFTSNGKETHWKLEADFHAQILCLSPDETTLIVVAMSPSKGSCKLFLFEAGRIANGEVSFLGGGGSSRSGSCLCLLCLCLSLSLSLSSFIVALFPGSRYILETYPSLDRFITPPRIHAS